MIVGIVLGLMYYVEFILKVFGKTIKFPIHGNKFIYTLIILSVIYSVARNFIPAIAPF